MDSSGEQLSDASRLLKQLWDACAELDRLAGQDAHYSLVEAQCHLAAIAAELNHHGDLQAAITAALGNSQRPH